MQRKKNSKIVSSSSFNAGKNMIFSINKSTYGLQNWHKNLPYNCLVTFKKKFKTFSDLRIFFLGLKHTKITF